jgi:hypothetical protein
MAGFSASAPADRAGSQVGSHTAGKYTGPRVHGNLTLDTEEWT